MEQNFKIAVPEGCTVNIEKNDNFVIVTLDPNNWEPKNGDVIAFGNTPDSLSIGIFKMDNYDTFTSYATICGGICGGLLSFYETGWIKKNIRPSTEEEKKFLFDALAKEGKRWNAEKKRIEDLPRWRANLGDFYFYVNETLGVDNHSETKDGIDNSFYTSGNYFKTREAAERAAEKIRKILKESKAE